MKANAEVLRTPRRSDRCTTFASAPTSDNLNPSAGNARFAYLPDLWIEGESAMPPVSPKPSSERNIALCYVRRSVVRTEKHLATVEIQRENIMRLCEHYGWTPEWYEDVEGHKSAMHEKNRPGWLALKARLGGLDVATVVVNDLSRLQRNRVRLMRFIRYLRFRHIRLVLADQFPPIDLTTRQGRDYLELIASYDQWYSAEIAYRRKAHIQNKKSKHKTVGLPPFGTVRNTEGYLIPSTEGVWLLPDGTWEAGDIRKDGPISGRVWRGYFECAGFILEMFVEGRVPHEICQRLTQGGFAFADRYKRPALLETRDILRITHNWVEYGGGIMDRSAVKRHYDEMEIRSIELHPEHSVFDTELLYRVGETIVARSERKNAHKRRNEPTESTYSFTGVFFCSHCYRLAKQQNNPRLISRLLAHRRGKYFVHLGGLQCGRERAQVSQYRLEYEFLEIVKRLALKDPDLNPALTYLETSFENVDAEAFEKEKAAALKHCGRKLDAIRHVYCEGDMSREEYHFRKAEIEEEINHWQAKPGIVEPQHVRKLMAADTVGNLLATWKTSSEAQRNRMAKKLFKYLVYDLDKQKIVAFKLTPAFEPHLVLEERSGSSRLL